ncbi:hypothetical protein, variant [Exophiala xenobiotica]|nr:hypothetical protein, variant [Exophiala xenobiotica]KIW56192.1 hypothetical protein, variant [Exophiala xenobiotica]
MEMSTSVRPDRLKFEIAIICALPLEAEPLHNAFNEIWATEPKEGDGNACSYVTGVIENHKVVLVLLPSTGIASASGTAASVRSSFPNIKWALVVGICGGVPYDSSTQELIRLGDIIISHVLVRYRFGKQYPDKFEEKAAAENSLERLPLEVRSMLANLKTRLFRQKMQQKIFEYLQSTRQTSAKEDYPGVEYDKLYEPAYLHKHHDIDPQITDDECMLGEKRICREALETTCEELGCEANRLVNNRLITNEQQPSVHFGGVGSGDTVMKSGKDRDDHSKARDLVAFEMEAAGVWDHFPTLLIRGVSDYADSHKNKRWQHYAAATAAACLKAFLGDLTNQDGLSDRSLVSIPMARNINFVGRDRILQDIHRAVTAHSFQGSDCIKYIVYGMGGIGKTQTILEYAYRYRKHFSSVFWVRANSYESAMESYITIAQKIERVDKSYAVDRSLEKKDFDRAVTLVVKEWWTARENCNWLSLFDGWDGLDDERIESLIPHGGSGVILITSRRQDWARAGESLDIPLMQEATSLLLLEKSSLTKYSKSNQKELDAAKEIVNMLGHLPLAIDQAGAHIHTLKIQAGKYLARLKENAETLDWKPPANVWVYGKTVLRSWELTFKELEISHSDVLKIFQVCAFLAGENISESLLRDGFNFGHMDPLARTVEDGMGILFSFSLAKREGAGDGFSIHPILQTCIRYRLCPLQRQRFLARAILVVAGAVSRLAPEREQAWFTYRQLLSHVNSCEGHLGDCSPPTIRVGSAKAPNLHEAKARFILGSFCDQLGQHDQAIRWFKRGLDPALDPSTLSTLECRDGLFTAMLNKGHLHEALAEFQTLYTEAVTQLGVRHVLTNKIANTLGISYKKIGSWDKALEWYGKSLTQVREMFGENDQRTLAALNNMAVIYKEQKEYAKAETVLRDVLRKKEEALGEENLSTLETVMNLGILHGRRGRYDEALHLLRRALCGKEKQLGKDNPKTLGVKGNIANQYLRSGKVEDAIKLHKETYDGYKRIHGPIHQDIFTTADRLGEDYFQKGMYPESLRWYYEALFGMTRLLGKGNAKTLETVANIAQVFQVQGQFYQAIIRYKWALDLFRGRYGFEHPWARSVESQVRALLLLWHQRSRAMQSR